MGKGDPGSEPPVWLQQRMRNWSTLFKKYEERGQLNTTDCSFAEVNYKLFAKPTTKKNSNLSKKSKRKCLKENLPPTKTDGNFNELTCEISDFKDVDVSDLIDDNADKMFASDVTKMNLDEIHEQCKYKSFQHEENCSNSVVSVQKSIEDLVDYIESYLCSNLKVFLINRSESKILETKDYRYWHECTKKEMGRLEKYITKSELKDYIRYYNNIENVDMTILQNVIENEMGSNLKNLLVRREFGRTNSEKYLKYFRRVYTEWHRLIRDIPVDLIILYASNVIASCEKRKNRILASQSQTSAQCVLKFQGNSSDSVIST